MTEQELAEIRARLVAATPGPWEWKMMPRCCSLRHVCSRRADGSVFCDVILEKDQRDYIGPTIDDAQFIAHAPTDIAVLLAEVERLQAALTITDEKVEQAAQKETAEKGAK